MTVTGSSVISLVGDSLIRNLTFKHMSELMKENLSAENKHNHKKNDSNKKKPKTLRLSHHNPSLQRFPCLPLQSTSSQLTS
jgi:hypothetical protein